ncbi:MAG: energy transducer TonB [Acidobacteriota bacterium]|nr:energy transducer TonB [Acidobacteriota bacterium]
MKFLLSAIAIVVLSSFSYSQSGRRAKEIRTPVPVPPPEVNQASAKPATAEEAPPVTAEKNQDYRCMSDGSLARILDPDAAERILTAKEVDTRVLMTAKPKPSYTKEARRNGIQGFVILKVLLSGDGKISRVRVVKRLPAGLTENAIRAACKIEFKSALKDGKPVSQWVTAEYVFRLADSSIFTP